MVSLSLLDRAKDMAARLRSTPYLELVEEATDKRLEAPKPEAVALLCDNVNVREENAADVVRAVRRRMTSSDVTVQYLTILVLETLVKNCGLKLHLEVASQKGLIRDIFKIATSNPSSEREYLAKEAALVLILNFSVWFAGHPNQNLKFLMTVANAVRREVGPNAFDGISPDVDTRLSMTVGPVRRPNHGHSDSVNSSQRTSITEIHPGIVAADTAGIRVPTEEELSNMLDVCVTLAEYLNNATILDDGTIVIDDIIESILSNVRRDNDFLLLLIGSDLILSNRETLVDICNSQSTLIQQLNKPEPFPLNSGDAHPPPMPPTAHAPDPRNNAIQPTAPAVQRSPLDIFSPPQASGNPANVPLTSGSAAAMGAVAAFEKLLIATAPQESADVPVYDSVVAEPGQDTADDQLYSSEEAFDDDEKKPNTYADAEFDTFLVGPRRS
uniref:Uncharacterized protein TCIL3000_11_11440 n=1 Tax=Trypanosoma congolense (strain IL3000) TaxID=1068625 RepID=G0V1Y4_TRYCI|nr:unnamed protein product [Trypanosoma congolense IL3000]